MNTAWTGGQYSVYRFLLGAYLAVHFAMLLPYGAEVFATGGTVADAAWSPLFGVLPNPLAWHDTPAAVSALLFAGIAAGTAVAVGWGDRVGAIASALTLGWLFQRNPLIANPSLPLLGWLLVLHAFVPPRPYGSLAGALRGTDPAWRLPKHLFLAVWVMLALCYSHSGWTKLASPSWMSGDTIRFVLENPLARDHALRTWLLATPPIVLQALTWGVLWLEALFAPLAVVRGFRPWLWLGMALTQVGFLTLLNFADLTFPMLLVHLLAFDPAWLRRFGTARRATVLFDGDCAFCHATVRLALHEDRAQRLRFAPLAGCTASRLLGAGPLPHGGDSIVLVDEDGTTHVKSRAVVAVLQRLGGLWLVPAAILRELPVRVGDAGYDVVGRWRYLLAGRRDAGAACPILPASAARLLP